MLRENKSKCFPGKKQKQKQKTFSGIHRSDGLNHHYHLKKCFKNKILSSKPQSQSQNLKDASQSYYDKHRGLWTQNELTNILVNGLNKGHLSLTCWSRCRTIPLFHHQFQRLSSLPWLGASTATKKYEERGTVKGFIRLYFSVQLEKFLALGVF